MPDVVLEALAAIITVPDETGVVKPAYPKPQANPSDPELDVSSLAQTPCGIFDTSRVNNGSIVGTANALNFIVPPNGLDIDVGLSTMSDGTAPAEIRKASMSAGVADKGIPLVKALVSATRADSWRTIVLVFAAVLACWKNTSPPTISASAMEM